jgi:hypothetical protein
VKQNKEPMNPTALRCALLLLGLSLVTAGAQTPPGWSPPWLDYWSFDNTTNWATYYGYPAASATNVTASLLGDYWTPAVDNTNGPAWLQYNITENDGTNHFKVDEGSIMFWFAPNWSGTNQGGQGPGEWSRLIEVGSYTTNASYGWWSLYVDPEGVNLYFSSQTNDGSGATYLSAPISWNITNRWHLITLTYSDKNTSLYLDDELVTNGAPLAYWPGPEVLTNGFFIGSDSHGSQQAHGMFDDLTTYDYEIGYKEVESEYWWGNTWAYANPMNHANFSSAPSQPSAALTYNAITGSGYLTPVSTNSAGCVTNSNIWITNVVATATNGSMNLRFSIGGGSEGVLYDLFANSILDFSSSTNSPWGWMGQGYHCVTYSLTNLPSTGAVFIILGTPQDSDGDGLTDAYELLVSKTNPHNPDTDGDGMLDGWEVQFGFNPRDFDDSGQSSFRLNFTYDLDGWLQQVGGNRTEQIGMDPEGNVQSSSR